MKLSEFGQDCEKDENVAPSDHHSSTQDMAKFESQVKELQNLSQDELMQKLVQEVHEQKERGVFDFDALVKGIEALKPLVGQQAYENLISVVEKFR